jgi:hypothetical protein
VTGVDRQAAIAEVNGGDYLIHAFAVRVHKKKVRILFTYYYSTTTTTTVTSGPTFNALNAEILIRGIYII